MSSHADRTCPYCGYTFETVEQRDAHVPCPEDVTDVRSRIDALIKKYKHT